MSLILFIHTCEKNIFTFNIFAFFFYRKKTLTFKWFRPDLIELNNIIDLVSIAIAPIEKT